MARGDHLYVRRGFRYSHHGIDCGDGTVIHHIREQRKLRVARTSLEEFAAGSEVRVRSHPGRLSAEDTLRNAESRVGSTEYSLVRNNCEHFAAWCSTGRARSSQVRRWLVGAPLVLAGAGAGVVTLLLA